MNYHLQKSFHWFPSASSVFRRAIVIAYAVRGDGNEHTHSLACLPSPS